MTRAHRGANWSGVPSLSQLWLTALLRILAMLVSNVAATVQMLIRRRSGECHTEETPDRLPQQTHDPIREASPAAPNSQTIDAIASRDERGTSSPCKGV